MDEPKGPTFGLMPGLTPEQGVGLDVPRIWANGVQITQTGENTFLVFREQMIFATKNDKDEIEERLVYKNVASVVIPQDTARQMLQILQRQLGSDENAEQVEDSGDVTA